MSIPKFSTILEAISKIILSPLRMRNPDSTIETVIPLFMLRTGDCFAIARNDGVFLRWRVVFCMVLSVQLATAQSPHAVRLYGMTQYGGAEHKGSIFHYTPSTKTVTIDYEFTTIVKGKSPKCDLVTPGNGKYYGTTTFGGTNDAGVIFEWDSLTGNYTEIHDFNGSDGRDPRGRMETYNGKLYGMTNLGGAFGHGVIYEFDYSTNIFTKKHDMDSVSGKNPDGSLTRVGNLLYGFARAGGSNNAGVLFEWNPATNDYTKKYDFDGTKGSNPIGKFSSYNGKLYAMTNTGGINNKGVIYEWNYSTNVLTKKIDFNGSNGEFPTGHLTFYNNKFYGMTYEGGLYEGISQQDHYGVIFEWNPVTNAFAKRRDMGRPIPNPNRPSSHGPIGSLTLRGSVFWGITTEGLGGSGAIFEWNPATNAYTDRYFNNARPNSNNGTCEEYGNAPGRNAHSTFLVSGNKLLGTASSDAGAYHGCIFEYLPDSNQIARSVHMLASDGKFAKGSLTQVGKKLYGLTYQGGNNHGGTIFEWDMSTKKFTERFQFDGYTTGMRPKNSLTWYNGKFYGINYYGRSKNTAVWSTFGNRFFGELFSWDPSTNSYLVIANSIATAAPLTLFNNKLYTTQNGLFTDATTNTIGYGAIVEFDPATNQVRNAAILPNGTGSFSNYQDNETANGLIAYNGKLYGMTPAKGPSGNINFKGTIYEWDPLLTITTNRYDFVDAIGYYPKGDLVQVGSEFYGLTGGVNGLGAGLFKWNPTTGQIEKIDSYGSSGTPTYSEGKIYYFTDGLSSSIVEYDPVLNVFGGAALPTFPGSGPVPYDWFNFNCGVNSYQKLLEVIPNEDPILVTAPLMQITCSNQTDTAVFVITDADKDIMSYQIVSSNTALLPIQNIVITNVDSLYTLTYAPLSNQIGTSVVAIVANDGYGGGVNFSFTVNILALPVASVTPMGATTICQGDSVVLTSDSASSYLWNTGATSNSISVTTSGNYFVMATDANGCSKMSDAISILFNPLPQATVVQTGNIFSATQTNASYQWLDCANNIAIPAATNSSFTPTSSGSYAVMVTNSNNCSDTSTCINYVTTSVPSTEIASDITLFPNPFTDKIQVEANAEFVGSVYFLFDETGKTVLSGKLIAENTILDLSNLSVGIYWFTVGTDRKKSFKVIKR
jgi:uncharacterized repeat protein (TIGR03803 family)